MHRKLWLCIIARACDVHEYMQSAYALLELSRACHAWLQLAPARPKVQRFALNIRVQALDTYVAAWPVWMRAHGGGIYRLDDIKWTCMAWKYLKIYFHQWLWLGLESVTQKLFKPFALSGFWVRFRLRCSVRVRCGWGFVQNSYGIGF